MSKKNLDHFKPANSDNGGLGGKNLILAIAASLIILGSFHFFYEKPRLERLEAEKARIAQTEIPEIERGEENKEIKQAQATQQKAAPKGERFTIESDAVRGSFTTTGSRIDELFLKSYDTTLNSGEDVQLLATTQDKYPYFAEFGWLSKDGNTRVPTSNSVWKFTSTSPKTLSPQAPVTMTYNNGQGITFERKISLDENYLFTVEDTVINKSGRSVTLFPYGLISRQNVEDSDSLFILHEGPIGFLGDSLKELDYEDLRDDGEIKESDENGWIGFTDKYWLTAIVPTPGDKKEGRFSFVNKNGQNQYQADIRNGAMIIENGAQTNYKQHFFAGAKKLSVLTDIEEKIGVHHFDRAIDFGWFYFITKPFFLVINFLFSIVGNFGIAIIIFTIILRLCMFPLANKAFRSMARMKKIAPKLEDLKARYGDDRMILQQKIMELYQTEKVSPLSGCAPMILQIPIFFALYKVLFVTIEMRHAPFYGWIQDLSQPDPTSIFNLFGLLPFDPPSFLMIGALPVIMCLTLVFQQQLNPKPQEPLQAKMMMAFPFFMTYILAGFPAGLVLYWTFSNIFSVGQQYVIMKSMGVPIGRKAHERAKAEEEAQKALDGDDDSNDDQFIDNDEAQRRRKELKQKKKALADKAKNSKTSKAKKKKKPKK